MTPAAAPARSMMDAVLMFQDPVQVLDGGGIIPMEQWVGRRMDQDDVLAAAQDGYGRDWFRYWHRRLGFDIVWGEGGIFEQARTGKSDKEFFDAFLWNQTYIFGHYGRGKSTKFNVTALQRAGLGIPVFHNGPLLGGWLVEGDDIFTVMQGYHKEMNNLAMPRCSVLGMDEAHGTANRRLAQATGVNVLRGLGANIRKLNVDWFLLGSQWKDVHADILDECVEALELIKVAFHNDRWVRVPEWDNISNFALAWQGWRDFPFRRMRERQKMRGRTDEDEDAQAGLGQAAYARLLHPEAARLAFAATNTFRMVDLPAITSNKDRIKNALRGIRAQSIDADRDPYMAGVLEFGEAMRELLESEEGDAPDFEYFRVGDVARMTGLPSQPLGNALKTLGLRDRDGRYRSADLINALFAEAGSDLKHLIAADDLPFHRQDEYRRAVVDYAEGLRIRADAGEPLPEYITAGQVAYSARLPAAPLGTAIVSLGLIKHRRGYHAGELIAACQRENHIEEGAMPL